MTSLALGLHEKLVKANGMAYATTDEYYKRIDETMRKRFPENFEEIVEEKTKARTKPSTAVARQTVAPLRKGKAKHFSSCDS